MSNIYKIKETDIQEFLSYNNTNKVILFYKQNCVFCKIQIDDLNKIANTYKENIDYAIVDVTNKRKYCLENDIVYLPTIHMYRGTNLQTNIHSYQEYDELLKLIKEVNLMNDEKKLSEEELKNVSGGEKITYPGFDGTSHVPNPSLDPSEDKPDPFDPYSGEGMGSKKPLEDGTLGK